MAQLSTRAMQLDWLSRHWLDHFKYKNKSTQKHFGLAVRPGENPVGKKPKTEKFTKPANTRNSTTTTTKKLLRKLVTFFTDANLHRCYTGFQVLSNVAHQLVSPQSSGHLCNEISLCLHHLDRCTVTFFIAIPGRWHSVENPLDC